MAEEMEALGAVVAGVCDMQVEGVCLYPGPTTVGALLVFNTRNRRQVNACKACSDYLFATGAWFKPGEGPPQHEGDPEGFRRFVWEAKRVGSPAELGDVAGRFADKTWILRVPLSAGDYVGSFWIVDVNLGALGWVRVAFPGDDEVTPAVVRVRPIQSSLESEQTGGALLVVTERLA